MAEWALAAVIFQKVSKHGRRSQIVDCCDFNVISFTAFFLKLKNAAECKASDTAETVNTNFYCHIFTSLGKYLTGPASGIGFIANGSIVSARLY